MPSHTATPTLLSAGTFLYPSSREADPSASVSEGLAATGVARAALSGVRRLSRSAAGAVDDEVGDLTAELLEIDLGDALVMGWKRWRALTDAAHRTRARPGQVEVVELVAHRVRSDYRPSIDLLVDEVRVTTLEFHLSLVFHLTGVSAVVRDGMLEAVRGGGCTLTAKLTLEGATLAEREREVDLAVLLPLPHPIRLVDPEPPRVPQQRETQARAQAPFRPDAGRR